MHVWNVRHAARCKYRTQKSCQKSPSGHNRTTLSGYIFATKAYINNRKNLVKQQYVSTCPHNMVVNFGSLTAEISSGVWGTPANFNCFRVLAALLHGIYTVNHKKRDILFLTITLANLDRFLQLLYHFNREEILHATVVKICHITRFMCTPYLEKLKRTFCRDSWNVAVYIDCTNLSNLNRFQ